MSCYCYIIFFYCDVHHRDLHSFPTRRSSDLINSKSPASSSRSPLSANANSDMSQDPQGIPFVKASACGNDFIDRKSTRLNSSHRCISYAVFCLKKKKTKTINTIDLSKT